MAERVEAEEQLAVAVAIVSAAEVVGRWREAEMSSAFGGPRMFPSWSWSSIRSHHLVLS